MEMHQILFVIFIISSPLAVSAWDVAVAAGNEIKFLNSSKDVIASISDSMVSVQALTYNPEQQLFFYSDNILTNGSIFSFKIFNNQPNTVSYADLRAIVSEQDESVHNLAYDYKTQILYWTTGLGHEIKWLKLGSVKPEPGQILYQFKNKMPVGLAIDSCKRYLYWTNCPQSGSGATIERSLLNGSEIEVLIDENLHQPLGLVLDHSSQRMFWIDDMKNSVVYKVESATFTGHDRRTIIHGTHHQPISLTISQSFVYWTDRTNTAVWKLPVNANSDTNPIQVLDMSLVMPTGLTSGHQTSSNYVDQECSPVVEPKMKIIDATVETISATTVEVAEKLNINVSNHCLNHGLLQESMICDCPPRFRGSRCEIDVCHNYCYNGMCEVDSAGAPRCRRCKEGWVGDRCQWNVCKNYCMNNGKCLVQDGVQPKCECAVGWSGERCEVQQFERQKLENDLSEVCRSYCSLFTKSEEHQNQLPSEICSCSFDASDMSNGSARSDIINIGELREKCMWKELNEVLLLVLSCFCIALLMLVAILTRKVFALKKRPRIKKRIIVNKTTTPLTSRPQPEQCEITIENCCNMNICETPCFEPEFRTPCTTLTRNGKKKEENKSLLGNIELPPDDLY